MSDFKDKNNGGRFYNELHNYISNDDQLYNAIDDGYLEINSNNWWECYLIGPDNTYYDLMWALDASFLLTAVDEVEHGLDFMIDVLEADKSDFDIVEIRRTQDENK